MIEPLPEHNIERNEHRRVLQSLQRIVLEETQGGRLIVRNLVSILDGDDPDARPSHRLQSARILLNLGFEGAVADLNAASQRGNSSPSLSEEKALADGEQTGQSLDSVPPPANPEHEKVNKKLVARIRVDSGGGASIVRVLLDILEGNDPDAKTRDRIEAAKVLLHWGFGNPAQPDPVLMMFYAPCHPDCLCVCKDLPEDHQEVVKAHTPLTQEQREQRAGNAEFMDSVADSAARKVEQIQEWKRQEYYSPAAVDERRHEREERRKRRERKQELNRRGRQDPIGDAVRQRIHEHERELERDRKLLLDTQRRERESDQVRARSP